MKDQKKVWSRRQFINSTAAGMAGIMVMPGIASKGLSQAEGDVRLGFIGMGQQSMFLLNGFLQIPGVQVVAGCDVYGIKRKRFEKRVTAFYTKAGKETKVETYEKYQDILKRTDINAVVIAVPDHSHAMIAIAACKAGKDVYLEKPMTFTIKEGQELKKAVRQYKRILAVGSQQRSDPKPYDLPAEPVPADLNWDLWLGSLPETIHFNNQLDPPITLEPEQNEKLWGAWRWYKEMGGGFTTDWGAHMFDIAQWGLGMDRNGPVEASPIGDGTEYMSFKYADGVVMTSEPFDQKKTKGVKFWGENGWIEVARGYFNSSDLKFIPEKKDAAEGPYETKIPHQLNFIESVRSRIDPTVPVEIGHSSCTVCTIGNIACALKRTVKWNPSTETFVDDIDGKATKLMHYEYRAGWKLV
jgi:predicted dehydrogenase